MKHSNGPSRSSTGNGFDRLADVLCSPELRPRQATLSCKGRIVLQAQTHRNGQLCQVSARKLTAFTQHGRQQDNFVLCILLQRLITSCSVRALCSGVFTRWTPNPVKMVPIMFSPLHACTLHVLAKCLQF